MNTKLAKLEGHSVNELQVISDNIKKYVDTENDAALQIAVEKINSRPSIWRMLFPDDVSRAQNKMILERMNSVYEAKKLMLELYTETQLEIARQQGDALVAATGMELRDQLTKFANQKINSLTSTLEESREQYMDRISRQLDNAEKYRRHIELYEDYKKSLKFEWKQYFSFVEDLIVGFSDALNAKVDQLNHRR